LREEALHQFLQAARMKGQTVDFGKTVVIMTSNVESNP
jgi:ATP-dependent Clp protease ATP-binding subunit ClpA